MDCACRNGGSIELKQIEIHLKFGSQACYKLDVVQSIRYKKFIILKLRFFDITNKSHWVMKCLSFSTKSLSLPIYSCKRQVKKLKNFIDQQKSIKINI